MKTKHLPEANERLRPAGPWSPALGAGSPRQARPRGFQSPGTEHQASKEKLNPAAGKGAGPSSDISAATWVLGDSGAGPEGG